MIGLMGTQLSANYLLSNNEEIADSYHLTSITIASNSNNKEYTFTCDLNAVLEVVYI